MIDYCWLCKTRILHRIRNILYSTIRVGRVGGSSPSFSLPSAASSSAECLCHDGGGGKDKENKGCNKENKESDKVDKENKEDKKEERDRDGQEISQDKRTKDDNKSIESKKNCEIKQQNIDKKENFDIKKEIFDKKENTVKSENCSQQTTVTPVNDDDSSKKPDEKKKLGEMKKDSEKMCTIKEKSRDGLPSDEKQQSKSENVWWVTAASTDGKKEEVNSKKLKDEEEDKTQMKLELKDVGVGVDEEEKLSARARKIYLMKELFGDDSVVDEVGRDIYLPSLHCNDNTT